LEKGKAEVFNILGKGIGKRALDKKGVWSTTFNVGNGGVAREEFLGCVTAMVTHHTLDDDASGLSCGVSIHRANFCYEFLDNVEG
jgi:hypothetical protein